MPVKSETPYSFCVIEPPNMTGFPVNETSFLFLQKVLSNTGGEVHILNKSVTSAPEEFHCDSGRKDGEATAPHFQHGGALQLAGRHPTPDSGGMPTQRE